MDQKSRTIKSLFQPMDLTQGTCWKTILIFSLPIILSYLLQQVYSISDAAIVGQTLTAQEVAGVNDTTSLVFIFLQFAFGVSAGFCVVTSCSVGCRDQAGVRRSLATQLLLSAVLTVLLTALALSLLNPMLAWINVTPDMDEMKISSRFTRAVISKLLKMMVKKKLGYEVDIQLNELTVRIDDEKAHAHVSADADLTKEELTRIFQTIGF